MSTDPTNVNPLDCNAVGPECPVEGSIYGYYPSLGWNAFFAALFGLCFVVNLGLGWRYRTWTYMLAMLLACAASTIGYVGRCILHSNPFNSVGFEMQICCLTLSAALNSAAIYLTLKHVVLQFGREWSRIRPKYYTWGFISADIAALALQGAGGGIAATSGDDDSSLNVGDNLMITGISWQVLTLLVFGVAVADYAVRRFRSSAAPLSPAAHSLLHDAKFQTFAAAVSISYVAILIRCTYRIAEMANGWQNPIMQNQALFIGADSCMVALATVLQTFIHPGIFFPALAAYRKSPLTETPEVTSSQSSVEKPTV